MPEPLATSLAGVEMVNPIMLAPGTCGTLDEISPVIPLRRIGALVTKSITPLPRDGNPPWRIIGVRTGMMNAVGLANPGIDAFEKEYLPRAASMPTAIWASVAGFSIDDYVLVGSRLHDWKERGVRGLELNLSCPNVHAGVEFGQSARLVRDVVTAVRAAAPHLPMLVKFSPVAPDLASLARAAIESGASGLTIGNTIPALAIDVRTRRAKLANTTGGLSGAAIHHVSVRAVHEVHAKVARDAFAPGKGVPIVGVGGILTWEDAAEFILAGASAVGIGTALFINPTTPLQVCKGLARWVRDQRCASIAELVGAMRQAG